MSQRDFIEPSRSGEESFASEAISLACPERHKVPRPLPSFREELGESLGQLQSLFSIPKDPLKRYRGKPLKAKVFTALGWFLPCVDWICSYKKAYFLGDLAGGISAWTLVPEDLGYAHLAGLPPGYGLFTSFLPPLVYAILGTSRHLCVGPTPMISLLVFSLCTKKYDPFSQRNEYIALVTASTFFAGCVLAGLGLLRMGFLADLLSHAAILGFLAGASIISIFVELGNVFGYTSTFTDYGLQDLIKYLIDYRAEFNWRAFLIGISFFIFLNALKFLDHRYSSRERLGTALRCLRISGPIISVVLATFFVYITRADLPPADVPTVQLVDRGWTVSERQVFLEDADVPLAIAIGSVVGLTAFAEAIAISRTFAAAKGYQIRENKEMLAMGAVNLVSALSGGFTTAGSFPRSSIIFRAGASTQLFSVILSVGVLAYIFALDKLFAYVPVAVLSAVIIDAVMGLIRIPSIVHLWRTDKADFLVFLATFVAILFIEIQWGIVAAVVAACLKLSVPISRPNVRVLGEVPGTGEYRALDQYVGAEEAAGICVVGIDAPIVFSNAKFVGESIAGIVEDRSASAETLVKYLALDFSPVTDIDTTGIHALFELTKSLSPVQIGICNPSKVVLRKLVASKFLEIAGTDNVFFSVKEAVQHFNFVQKSLSNGFSMDVSIRTTD